MVDHIFHHSLAERLTSRDFSRSNEMEQQQSRNQLRFSIDYILSSDIESNVRRQIDEAGNPKEAKVRHTISDSTTVKETSPGKRGSQSETGW